MTFWWLRRLIRSNTKPIERTRAESHKRTLSLAYMFFAWNAIAIVCYNMYNGKKDWAEYHGIPVDKTSPAIQFSRMMDIPKAKVLRMKGLTLKEEIEVDNNELFNYERDPKFLEEQAKLKEQQN